MNSNVSQTWVMDGQTAGEWPLNDALSECLSARGAAWVWAGVPLSMTRGDPKIAVGGRSDPVKPPWSWSRREEAAGPFPGGRFFMPPEAHKQWGQGVRLLKVLQFPLGMLSPRLECSGSQVPRGDSPGTPDYVSRGVRGGGAQPSLLYQVSPAALTSSCLHFQVQREDTGLFHRQTKDHCQRQHGQQRAGGR